MKCSVFTLLLLAGCSVQSPQATLTDCEYAVTTSQDQLERAQDLERNARTMLSNARGLQQHVFWNAKIDQFQTEAIQKRRVYDQAVQSRDDCRSAQEVKQRELETKARQSVTALHIHSDLQP